MAGFDALLLDREHSAASIETCVHAMRAIRTAGDSTILARAAENDTSELKRLLDAGVEGVLLANVESADEARHAVSACATRRAAGAACSIRYRARRGGASTPTTTPRRSATIFCLSQ